MVSQRDPTMIAKALEVIFKDDVFDLSLFAVDVEIAVAQ